MERMDRAAPLPEEMQGRWVIIDEPSAELVIEGGEVTCFGQRIDYDHKEVVRQDGALTVSLRIDDATNEDTFRRANITDLVITPEGDFLAYNVRFASQFIRSAS
ncbi:MAG TPA: hypothetical protein VH331_16600 [Allosphingosinicella sp.]|jgi:hypothetical protein|nr:hypothetical protein [Allosphingosinicella sp.]